MADNTYTPTGDPDWTSGVNDSGGILRFSLRTVFSYIVLLTAVLFCFQNCAKYSFKSLTSDLALKSTSGDGGGNGGGYDGKPDASYFRFLPGFNCEGKESFKDLIEVRKGRFYIFENRVDFCATTPRELSPSLIEDSGLEKEVVTYNDHIYRRYPFDLPHIPDSLSEVLCRDDFKNPQVEVIASFDQVKNLSRTQVYVSQSSSNIQSYEDLTTVRNSYETKATYSAFNGELEFQILLDQLISGSKLKFKGEITLSSGSWSSRTMVKDLVCVTGAYLEPYIGTFSNKMSLSSSGYVTNTMYLQTMTEHNGALMGAAQVTPASALGFNMKSSLIGIYRSLDSGLSWSLISNHQSLPGANTQAPRLLSGPNALYLYGVYGIGGLFISESQDGGLTWTNKMKYETGISSAAARGAVLTKDNSLLLVGHAKGIDSGLAFARKCNLSTWLCVNTDEHVSNHSFVDVGTAVQDGFGNIYLAYRFGATSMNTAVFLSKSTDQGATWNIIETYPNASTGIDSLAVSSDGQMMIYTGRSGGSSPYMRQSSDGGMTWVSTTNTCNGTGWGALQVILAPNKDALNTCYEYLGAPGYANHVNRKPAGSTNWSNLFSVGGTSGGTLYTRPNQDVLYFDPTLATLKKTSDFGTNWSALSYPPPSSSLGDAQIFSVLENGPSQLFAVGYTTVAGGASKGTIYQSTDAGRTWNISFSLGSANSAFTTLARSSKSQSLFASGLENKNGWTVYKYNKASSSWSMVDKYTPAATSLSTLNSSFTDKNGAVYSVGGYGFAIFNTYLPRWLVRMSADDGATWSTIDDQGSSSSTSEAFGGTADSTGTYVSGFSLDSQNQTQWTIRKYSGGQWTVEDTGAPVASGVARGMLTASDGSLYAVGEYLDSNKIKHWIVKRKMPNSSWAVVDDFNLATKMEASAFSITEDAFHRILVSGLARDVDGIQYALIRANIKGAWVTVDQSLSFSTGVAQSLTPCLGTRVCAAVNGMNAEAMYNGFVRILDR